MIRPLKMAMLAFGMVFAVVGGGSTASMAQTAQAASRGAAGDKELTLDLGNKVTIKLVRIPAGKFVMGTPATEMDRDKDETQHEVTISKRFYIGVTHVTVDQFAAFVQDSGYKTAAEKEGWGVGVEIKDGQLIASKMKGCSWRKPTFDQQGDHPVVQVTWNDAKAFCDWLSKKSGKTVGLPTEAQWEFAGRAGTKTAYPWGDDPSDGKGWANCADQSHKRVVPNAPAAAAFFSWDDGFVFTSPVASFKPNAFGLYDMVGNAWQWCEDRFGEYEKGPVTDPTGAATGGLRVLRGGSWGFDQRLCRTGGRSWSGPAIRFGRCGFRVTVAAGGD